MRRPPELERSIELLRSWLSPEQLATFDDDLWFEVIGCDTGRRYTVRAGAYIRLAERPACIEAVSDEGHREMWCIVPEGIALYGDVMLAQKIGLETNELDVLSRANKL